MTTTKKKHSLDQVTEPIYHIKETQHQNTYGFIVNKEIDFDCSELSCNQSPIFTYLKIITPIVLNIAPIIGTAMSYSLQRNLAEVKSTFDNIGACPSELNFMAAAIAVTVASDSYCAFNPMITMLQKVAFISVPSLLVPIYSLFQKSDSFHTQVGCGEMRDEILREVGCPTGWSTDVNFLSAYISLTCTPPEAMTDEIALQAICDRNTFIKNIIEQGNATLENEIEYSVALHPNIKPHMDCSTGILTDEDREIVYTSVDL